MRHITDHKVNGLNEALSVVALDNPGPGGANHAYQIYIDETKADLAPGVTVHTTLNFQNGPIASPKDFNGLTNETIIAVAIDRMRGFQYGRKPDGSFDENIRGKYACRDNAIVLTLLEDALMRLQKRTNDRMRRGVEGTMTP